MHYILSKENPQVTENCVEYIKQLPLNKKVFVEIKEYRRNRSNAQNRLMWMWYDVISKDTGHEREELHEMMKAKVLGFETVIVPAKFNDGLEMKYQRPRSSTTLSVEEMTGFMHAIESLARQLNIALPYPQDYAYAMGYETK